MMITKQTKDLQNLDYLAGQVILIDKPVNWTSFNVVSRVRRLTKVKKVGHAGTLDPLATGLLIVCTGKKTKEIFEYQAQRKKYTGIITLGKSSPSMDLATEIMEKDLPDDLNEEKILFARNKFLGNIEQVPPMFSALKHKGKALYKLARAGKEVERAPRQVEIFSFDITKIELPDLHFEIACSKGTYIRSLCSDIAKKLGTIGCMSDLERLCVGRFDITESITLETINNNIENINNNLITIERLFDKSKNIILEDKKLKLFLNGVQLKVKEKDGAFKIYNNNKFIGIGCIKDNILKRDIIII